MSHFYLSACFRVIFSVFIVCSHHTHKKQNALLLNCPLLNQNHGKESICHAYVHSERQSHCCNEAQNQNQKRILLPGKYNKSLQGICFGKEFALARSVLRA